jgi:F0F1-type ATP synthase membrane subunit b/b'
MDYIGVALLGMAGGAFCVFMLTEARRKVVQEHKRALKERAQEIHDSFQELKTREARYDQEQKRAQEELNSSTGQRH